MDSCPHAGMLAATSTEAAGSLPWRQDSLKTLFYLLALNAAYHRCEGSASRIKGIYLEWQIGGKSAKISLKSHLWSSATAKSIYAVRDYSGRASGSRTMASSSTQTRTSERKMRHSFSLLTGKMTSEEHILKRSKKSQAIKKQLGQNHKMDLFCLFWLSG